MAQGRACKFISCQVSGDPVAEALLQDGLGPEVEQDVVRLRPQAQEAGADPRQVRGGRLQAHRVRKRLPPSSDLSETLVAIGGVSRASRGRRRGLLIFNEGHSL